MMLLTVPLMMRAHEVHASSQSDEVPLLIKKVVVTGFQLYKSKIAKDLNKKYAKKRLTSAEIDGIVDELKAAYREAGYVGLIETTQQLRRGVITIHVSLSKT